MASLPPNGETPPTVAVPVDASGSETALLIRGFLFQLIIAGGVLVTVLGLGEGTTLVKWIRFFQREEVVPIITAIAAALASGWQLLRGLRKHRSLQVLSFLLPNRVAKSPTAPSTTVVTAAAAAERVLEVGARR